MGYGDVGYMTNGAVTSPNIDKLASKGVKFSQWISADSICTPSRGALLTGRLPIRLGLSSGVYYERVLQPLSPGGLPLEEITIAERLKEHGYVTKIVGKWHLGIGKEGAFLPTRHGFDSFYGLPITNVQSCGHKPIYAQRSLQLFLWENTREVWTSMFTSLSLVLIIRQRKLLKPMVSSFIFTVLCFAIVFFIIQNFTLLTDTFCLLYNDENLIQQPLKLENLTQRLTHNTIDFIRESHENGSPFFLYMSYVKLHTALFNNPEFNLTDSAYQNNILELDWSIGAISQALEDLDVFDDTLIWFTSDNGPFLERGLEGGSTSYNVNGKQGKLKGGKAQTYEGGIRVPGFAVFGKKFPRNQWIHEPVSTMDIFPTTLSLVSKHLNKSTSFDQMDGKDLSGLIQGTQSNVHDFMFHYCGDALSAIRVQTQDKVFKVTYKTPVWDDDVEMSCRKTQACQCEDDHVENHDPPLVFELSLDQDEMKPLKYTAEIEEIVKRAEIAKSDHVLSIKPVVSQVKMYQNPLLKLDKGLCCNFPSCECDKEASTE